ncbi:unnamed protein product [Adineta steineri]|uniref:Uncharacterized protein n=1 Tax=Adineta steineri TaxID=433720 RepID=A0A813MSM3_9BILA|nr:unnamed protein product [Adineta steineri]CAF3647668.1 unnamed protein product [Adineta steineri]
MGSESLSHRFLAEDPTYKGKSPYASKSDDKKSASHHSVSHTSGTHPVALSNGPNSSSPPTASKIKHKYKSHPKYKKLYKVYKKQLAHMETTVNAIDSLSKSPSTNQNQMLSSIKKRIDELNGNLDNLNDTPSLQDHIHFDPIKVEIKQLLEDLKSYKLDNKNSNSINAIDHLVGLSLNVSDSDDNEENTTL